MEQQSCKYHPRKSPHWYCENCDIHFCGQCIPGSRGNYYKNAPKCFLCNNEIDYQGGAHGTEPFWRVTGGFFTYPLKLSGLLAITTITGAIYLATTLPWVIALGLSLGILAGITRYTMLIIEESSQGKTDPPAITGFVQADPDRLFLKVLAIFILIGAATGFLQQGSPLLGLVMYSLFNLFIPAIIMLLAISKSMLVAINPLNILSFVVRIGLPYLLLVVCLLIVSSGPQYVLPFLLLKFELPGWLAVTTIVVVSIYFMFVTSRMMGYTVYQYQGVLGYSSNDDDKYYLEPDDFEKKVILGKAHMFIQEGRFEESHKLIRSAINQDSENLEYHDYLHKLLIATNSLKGLKTHGEEITRILLKRDLHAKAAKYYMDSFSKGAKFTFEDSEVCFQVADALYQLNQYKPALQLLNGLHKRDPEYAGLFDAYFLAARVFVEGLNEDSKGAHLLDFIQQKFPQHARLNEVQKYRKNLLS